MFDERWVHSTATKRLLKGKRNTRILTRSGLLPESRYRRIMSSIHWCIGVSKKTFELSFAILMVLYVLSFTHLSFFRPSIKWDIQNPLLLQCRTFSIETWKGVFICRIAVPNLDFNEDCRHLELLSNVKNHGHDLVYLFVIPICQGHPCISRNPVT